MPGAPDFTTDLMLQAAISEGSKAFKKGGCNLINFDAPDPEEEVGMDEINALGLKPTGIGVRRGARLLLGDGSGSRNSSAESHAPRGDAGYRPA